MLRGTYMKLFFHTKHTKDNQECVFGAVFAPALWSSGVPIFIMTAFVMVNICNISFYHPSIISLGYLKRRKSFEKESMSLSPLVTGFSC